jgi:hypothetical protein
VIGRSRMPMKPPGDRGAIRPCDADLAPTTKTSYRNGMPLWFANGSDATTGNRVITTPIAAPERRASGSPWPFRKTPAHLLRAAIARATRPPLMRAERTTLLTSELREARDKGVIRGLAPRHVDNERGGDIGEEAEEAIASTSG